MAHLASGLAGIGAGAVNAMAGGGTLISFPVMTAFGVPTVQANATNTVALCPGYVGGTYAQRRELDGLAPTLKAPLMVAACFGFAGSVLLVVTSESLFRAIVPFLILASCGLLAVQDRLRAWMNSRSPERRSQGPLELAGIGLASTYGGYFGAGLGIMLLAVLGLFTDRPIRTSNAVKSLIAFVVNVFAAAFLAGSGTVSWSLVAVMAPASLLGGHVGGRLVGRIPPTRLRTGIVAFGVVVALIYLFR